MSHTSRSPELNVLVVGAGPTADAHVRALLALDVVRERILVVGRGRERAEVLAAEYGVRATHGGLNVARDAGDIDIAVVAIREDECAPAARALVAAGVGTILIEKPGALEADSLRALADSNVFVGYNRRFYASTVHARAAIEDDGGLLSCFFDFTEVPPLVLDTAKRRGLPAEILARWGIVNSLHVIDLALFLAGRPKDWRHERRGALDWHPSGATFAGTGATEQGAMLVYLATWSGAGRWAVEVTTPKRKLVLRPLEELHEQPLGSFALEPVALEHDPPGTKPGFVPQLRAVLDVASGGPVDDRLCGAAEAAELVDLANDVFGYAPFRRTT